MRQKNQPMALTPEGRRIVDELQRNGIAITTLEALLSNDPLPSLMMTWISDRSPVENTASKKKFLREYWPLVPTLDFSNPFLRFALHNDILGIVNAYMGMWSRLTQYDLRKTLPVMDKGPVQSQRWHRDPEEKRILKIFVYLNDVDSDAGPFTFARKSTHGNTHGKVFPQRPPEGCYPAEEDVRKAIPASDIQSFTGRAGTVIFCDTSGLHFGGRATMKERIMSTTAYNSPAYTEGARYRWSDSTSEDTKSFSPQAQFALSGKQLQAGTNPMHA